MPNFNKVFLMGNLTKDPELRYTGTGAAVANLRMAINRTYQSKTGEKKEEVCFMTVVAWQKQAETVGEYLKKGDPLFVEGRLQSRTWETDDKQKRSTIEVVAERIQFLNRGKGGDSAPAHLDEEAGGPPASGASEEDIPF
ncbi:MAG TPA: single-stranded DNA-binding protein [bacterium]|nr:single-stranded DNA-binding protein [bacterium]